MNRCFIKATNEYCTLDKFVSAPYLRRSFEIEALPDSAEISICGLGFYRLFINGQEITRGHLAPYISNPDHICYYDTYDLLPYLSEGKNAIGIILGNGFINSIGGYVWDFDKAPFRGEPKVALSLIIKNREETTEIEADTAFKVHPSPIFFDDIRYGEYFDARECVDGWALPDFDDSDWENAIEAEAPRGDLLPCIAEPIRVYDRREPKEIIKSRTGYIYDFGINSAGLCRLNIKNTTKGQKLTLRYAEQIKDRELFVDSVVFPTERFPEYYNDNQKDIYICRGGDSETWMPSFTYHGFRYVLVEGISDEQATSDLLTFELMSSDLATLGSFECSDETINKLFDITVNSDLSNFYYFPTDCPHREKNGWTGDIAVSCFHMMMLYDCSKSFAQWLGCVRKAQNESGVIPGIVPTSGWGYTWGNGPAWDSAAFYTAYEVFRLRGDTQIIKDNAHMMVRYLEYIMTRRNEDGTIAFGLGDWASVGRRFSRFETSLAVSDSILVMDMARKAAEMFEAIGQSHSANFAKEIYLDMRHTIRARLLDTDTCTLTGRTQTAQAMGLYYGIFNADEKQKALNVLLDLIHEKEDSFDCGILGCVTIFHVLSDHGYGSLAFNMITKKEYPSYGHILELGETALPEHFMPDGAPCESHNHHFLGDISRWFIRQIAGLRVENSKKVTLCPDLSLPIEHAKAYYELPDGRVSIRWARGDDGISVEYTCPDGVECQLTFPENTKITRII